MNDIQNKTTDNITDRYYKIILYLSLLIGIVLRIAGYVGELWLDEIWNLEVVAKITNPLNLYLSPDRYDGHSSLHTLILSLFSNNINPRIIRAPSLFFSIFSLLLITFWQRLEIKERAVLSFLFSTSYLFVLYSTEARGYSGMMFFMVLAYLLFRSNNFTLVGELSLAISVILSFLFHYSVITFYIAILAHDILNVVKDRKILRPVSHITIVTFLLAFYILVLRQLPDGSGPRPSNFDTLIDVLSSSLGGTTLSPTFQLSILISSLIALFVLILIVILIYKLILTDFKLGIFFSCGIIIFPIILILVKQPLIVLNRYFLSSSFLILTLFSYHYSKSSKKLKFLLLAVFTIATIGNAWHLISLIKYQRGSYLPILNYLQKNQVPTTTPILVDHDFRHLKYLRYYQSKFPVIDILEIDSSHKYNFYVTHSIDWGFVPKNTILLSNKQKFQLAVSSDSTHLSGIRWFLYKSSNY
jgi:hypothetical protein